MKPLICLPLIHSILTRWLHCVNSILPQKGQKNAANVIPHINISIEMLSPFTIYHSPSHLLNPPSNSLADPRNVSPAFRELIDNELDYCFTALGGVACIRWVRHLLCHSNGKPSIAAADATQNTNSSAYTVRLNS